MRKVTKIKAAQEPSATRLARDLSARTIFRTNIDGGRWMLRTPEDMYVDLQTGDIQRSMGVTVTEVLAPGESLTIGPVE